MQNRLVVVLLLLCLDIQMIHSAQWTQVRKKSQSISSCPERYFSKALERMGRFIHKDRT